MKEGSMVMYDQMSSQYILVPVDTEDFERSTSSQQPRIRTKSYLHRWVAARR